MQNHLLNVNELTLLHAPLTLVTAPVGIGCVGKKSFAI